MSKKFGSFVRVRIHVWTNLGHSNSSTSPSQGKVLRQRFDEGILSSSSCCLLIPRQIPRIGFGVWQGAMSAGPRAAFSKSFTGQKFVIGSEQAIQVAQAHLTIFEKLSVAFHKADCLCKAVRFFPGQFAWVGGFVLVPMFMAFDQVSWLSRDGQALFPGQCGLGKQLRVCLAVSAVWPTYRPKKATGLYLDLYYYFLYKRSHFFYFFSLLGHSKPSHLKTGINCLPGYDTYFFTIFFDFHETRGFRD